MEPGEPMLTGVNRISAADLQEGDFNGFLDQVVDAERRTWPPELQASRQKFESRLRIFPKGFIAFEVNGRIEAVTTSQIVNYDPSDASHKTWDQITDNGMIEKTHNSSGNALYVVSVGVSKDSQGQGLGGKLVDEQKNLAKALGLKYLYLGARIPEYSEYLISHPGMTVEEYLGQKNDRGESVDPEIRFYERQGLRPARIIPDFEPDDESLGNGVVMVWQVE